MLTGVKRRILILLMITALGWGALVALVSCELFRYEPLTLAPINIPGAVYAGMETCGACHEKKIAEFRGAPHAAFAVLEADEEDGPKGEGCESCHGPGSLHIEGEGDKSKILKGDWRQCFACHLDKKSQFSLRYHHPVTEGRMTCSDCHDPHKGAKPVFRAEEANETCFSCHPDKRGPWTFPHEAVTEDGCSSCHNPHGSHINKLLVADAANLCMRCHFEAVRHPSIGRFSHSSGKYLLRGCHNCHRAIYGSTFSKSLRHE